jgi:lipopolysaccharide transport system ATP-binding protein
MTDTVITIDKLSKRYRIGLKEEIPDTLAGALAGFVRSPLRNLKRLRSLSSFQSNSNGDDPEDVIWALKDVSFEVKQGEVVGIIGRNGAGKSTLLKILSRITRPTSGEALIDGRVSSLLEVGTGFHPELTGRENIYLNGTILGMRKSEIDRKFDEIVAFSGVEKFIDTPVKRYSSGMQVRLAFSVAAHLEPEILIIDEVLAVGDVEFQKKCLGKMGEVAQGGRTVLFVSHNMRAVTNLCEKAILLRDGKIAAFDETKAVVEAYLAAFSQRAVGMEITPDMHLKYPPGLEIFRVELINRNDEVTDTLLMNEDFCIRLFYRIHQEEQSYRIGVMLRSSDDVRLTTTVSTDDHVAHLSGKTGEIYRASVQMKNVFVPGRYYIECAVKNFHNVVVDFVQGVPFSIEPVSLETNTNYREAGVVWLHPKWDTPVLCENSI